MIPDKNIEQELRELNSVLAGRPKTLPYRLPAGYFDALPEAILNRAKSENAGDEISTLSPLLAGMNKKMPYSTPEGYFEQLSERTGPESPLFGASRVMPNQVPAGYFEEFPESILNSVRAKGSGGAKVVSMGGSWVRYAAAAVVTAVLVLAGWLYVGTLSESPAEPAPLAKQLDLEIREISDEAILEYTNPTLAFYYGNTALSTDELNGFEAHDLLGDVSDEALQQYLQEFNGKNQLNMN